MLHKYNKLLKPNCLKNLLICKNLLCYYSIGQQWSLFNRFKSNRTTTTKSVNAEETVRQASRASATNEDHNFVS